MDENKGNNHVDNLCWCSCIDNINYGTRNERVSKTNSIPIQQYTVSGEFIREWKSALIAAKELNISQGNITLC